MLITIAGSNDPHGVFQLSQNSLEVRVQENAGTADLLVVRKFGAIGEYVFCMDYKMSKE